MKTAKAIVTFTAYTVEDEPAKDTFTIPVCAEAAKHLKVKNSVFEYADLIHHIAPAMAQLLGYERYNVEVTDIKVVEENEKV